MNNLIKEKPILFSAPMVRAILDGRKTQTRRVVKLPKHIKEMPKLLNDVLSELVELSGCPFGKVGDRLWVRENFGFVEHYLDENEELVPWVPDRQTTLIRELKFGKGYRSGHVIYEADGAFDWVCDPDTLETRSCWHPSIHLPRAAARILLEITNIRVERLQDISKEDAIAEGIISDDLEINGINEGPVYNDYMVPVEDRCEWYTDPRASFRSLWYTINGAQSWNQNPWVWVIEFKRLQNDDR